MKNDNFKFYNILEKDEELRRVQGQHGLGEVRRQQMVHREEGGEEEEQQGQLSIHDLEAAFVSFRQLWRSEFCLF